MPLHSILSFLFFIVLTLVSVPNFTWLLVFDKVLCHRQTILGNTQMIWKGPKWYKWKRGKYWGWSSPNLKFTSIVETMSRLLMAMGQLWWARAVARPRTARPSSRAGSSGPRCPLPSSAEATASALSSKLEALVQNQGGKLTGRQWHQVKED